MQTVYPDDYLLKLNGKKKKAIIGIVLIMACATATNVALLFLCNEDNVRLMQLAMSLIYIVAGWISLWILFREILTAKRTIYQIECIVGERREEIVGTVEKIGKPVTLPNAPKCYEISIKKDRTQKVLYFDELFFDASIKEHTVVMFSVSNNFVLGYEVIGNEE